MPNASSPSPAPRLRALRNSLAAADNQLLGEACSLLHLALGLTSGQLASILSAWNQSEIAGHLLESSAHAFAQSPGDPAAVLRGLLQPLSPADSAAPIAEALGLHASLSVIAASAFALPPSAAGTTAANFLHGPLGRAATAAPPDFTENVRRALACSRIVALAQAFLFLRQAATRHGWSLDLCAIANDWNASAFRGALLAQIRTAFGRQPDLPCLLLDPALAASLSQYQASWRKALVKTIALGLPMPATSSALAFYDAFRTAALPHT
jgi:6-phosphogluconate dehydrogenase